MPANVTNIVSIALAIAYVLLALFSAVAIPLLLTWITNTGVAGFIAFFTLVILIFVLKTLKIGYESESWPSVEGIISESYLDGTRQNNTSPRVVYQYLVNNETFTNTVIKTGRSVNILSDAEKVIAKYPRNKVVTVFYNPLKPQQSALETGMEKSALIFPVILLLIIIVASCFAFYKWPGIHAERFSVLINSFKQR
jgi:hypothetical protein